MIYHASNIFETPNADDKARMAKAQWTWTNLYQRNYKILEPAHSKSYARTAQTELGDPRNVPFLRDVILAAVEKAGPKDHILFTNADSCLVSDTVEWLMRGLLSREALWSHRFDMDKDQKTQLSRTEAQKRGVEFAGVDLVCFGVDWWHRVGSRLPDMLISYEGFDWIYRFAIGESGKIPSVVYHTAHGFPFWYTHRRTSPGNLYNRRLAREWVNSRDDAARIKAQWPGFKEYEKDTI